MYRCLPIVWSEAHSITMAPRVCCAGSEGGGGGFRGACGRLSGDGGRKAALPGRASNAAAGRYWVEWRAGASRGPSARRPRAHHRRRRRRDRHATPHSQRPQATYLFLPESSELCCRASARVLASDRRIKLFHLCKHLPINYANKV